MNRSELEILLEELDEALTRAFPNLIQAQQVVDHYFPSPVHQAVHQLSRTLETLFEE